MKAISTIALISVAVAGVSACASMDDGRADISPEARTIAADEIPPTHLDFVAAQAKRFFARPNVPDLKRARYTIASPSNVEKPRALRSQRSTGCSRM